LVIGIDAAPLARSAAKAGYTVFAADYFGDLDLRESSQQSVSIRVQEPGRSLGYLATGLSPEALLALAKRLSVKHQIDATILASGFEESPQALRQLHAMVPIVGNSASAIEIVSDKARLSNELKKLGIPHPKTVPAGTSEDIERAAKDIGYPVVLKPISGFGGSGVQTLKGKSELRSALTRRELPDQGILVQEFISGIDASASFLSSKRVSTLLTVNEQLLGAPELGLDNPFTYCGNIVPATFVNDELLKACCRIVDKISRHFGLLGSNGVDLKISMNNEPWVIEVNPRFQGSIECVERVLGTNLVKHHIEACLEGATSFPNLMPSRCCVRLILYAFRRSISPSICLAEARDVPLPGTIIEKGEPMCSLVVEGSTRDSALKRAQGLASLIYSAAEPAPSLIG
jgi:predicted ATP-grasp superfamily ATP-dependent carboligase